VSVITIEFLSDQSDEVTALATSHPELIKQVKTRHSIGGGHDVTLLISLAAMAIPAIKTVVVEKIKAGRYRSFSYKGSKITGHSAEDIEKILASLRKSDPPP
jgi:hypothetical protein